jgi:hypothetical protein
MMLHTPLKIKVYHKPATDFPTGVTSVAVSTVAVELTLLAENQPRIGEDMSYAHAYWLQPGSPSFAYGLYSYCPVTAARHVDGIEKKNFFDNGRNYGVFLQVCICRTFLCLEEPTNFNKNSPNPLFHFRKHWISMFDSSGSWALRTKNDYMTTTKKEK